MLGAVSCLILPFIVDGAGYTRNIVLIFFWGLIIDLILGVSLGLTSIFFILEQTVILLYSRKFELGLPGKLIIAVPSAIVYFYVSRRYFW